MEEPREGRLLLLDFADADAEWQLGDGVEVRRCSLADWSVGTGEAGDFAGAVLGLPMAWLALEEVLAGVLRALRPGGTLLFCTFGGDTLRQLRWAWQQVDNLPHVHPFVDMRAIGDQLLQCGFIRPVVDADRVTVEYADAATLYADLRAEGFVNVLTQRRKTLTGKERGNGFHAALADLSEPDGALAITFELIYGIATAPPPSSPHQMRVAPPQVGGRG